jgi:hypothetical protein
LMGGREARKQIQHWQSETGSKCHARSSLPSPAEPTRDRDASNVTKRTGCHSRPRHIVIFSVPIRSDSPALFAVYR